LFLIFIALAAQFFVAIAPPFTSDLASAEDFFKAYLALPVVLFFWACGYLWKREGFLKLDQIDLDTGRREHDWETINAYRAQKAHWPKWRKALDLVY
jgi:yeast amino acid transporter